MDRKKSVGSPRIPSYRPSMNPTSLSSKTSAGFASLLMATVIDLLTCQGETDSSFKTAICPTVTTVSDLARSLTVNSYFDLWDPYASTFKQIQAVKVNEKPHVTLWNRASILAHFNTMAFRPSPFGAMGPGRFLTNKPDSVGSNVGSEGEGRNEDPTPSGYANSKVELGPPMVGGTVVVNLETVSGYPDTSIVKKGISFEKSKEERVNRGMKRLREESLVKSNQQKGLLYVFLSKDGYYSVIPTLGLIPFDNFYVSKELKGGLEFKALKKNREERLFDFIKEEDKTFWVWLEKHPPWKLVKCCSYSEEEEKKITLELILSSKGKHYVGGLRWKEVLPSLSGKDNKDVETNPKPKYKKKRITGKSTTTFVIGQFPVAIENSGDNRITSTKSTGGYKAAANYTCNHCGKYGHRSHNCWSLKKKFVVVAC